MIQDMPPSIEPKLEEIFKEVKENVNEGSTREYSFIKMMIASMVNGKSKHESEILRAVTEDLGVDEATAYKMSIYPFFQELRIAFAHLREW